MWRVPCEQAVYFVEMDNTDMLQYVSGYFCDTVQWYVRVILIGPFLMLHRLLGVLCRKEACG